MKIVICGSSSFRVEKVDLCDNLKKLGHEPIIDPWTIELASGQNQALRQQVQTEHSTAKKKYGFIKWYYDAISESDAILVYNPSKKSIDNYIGANTFLEVGYAHVLGKKIFIFYSIPDQDYIKDELEAVEPIVLNGDINNIK